MIIVLLFFKILNVKKMKSYHLEFQYKRGFFVLFRFLDWVDKSGLKIPVSASVRYWLKYYNNPNLKKDYLFF